MPQTIPASSKTAASAKSKAVNQVGGNMSLIFGRAPGEEFASALELPSALD